MDERHTPEAPALLRRLFAAAREKSADLAAHLHPAWVQMAWQRIGLAGSAPADPAARRRRSQAFAQLYGAQWPSLARFAHRAHRIALLPRAEMLRVLAAVALHADRERVRRCIDKPLRGTMIERVGETAYRGLLAAPAPVRAEPAGRALAAEELDADHLAARGCAVLSAQGAWRCRQSLAWVRLALPPGVPQDHPPPAPSGRSEPSPVLDRLTDYFPEHAWLFGSPMDRALSA